ncbi:FAD:protein FMN transferase [Sphingobacterium sp. MYb382]|uniref:FAD:protein FMN transferase n=1 Tax=Sphingobacterium sp. MYb382 TaxID=2745278 RepID=UPI0030A0C3C9
MLRCICFWVLFFVCGSTYGQLKRYVLEGRAQGTTYRIVYYQEAEVLTRVDVDSFLNIIDLSMSTYRKESLISAFNNAETSELKLDKWMLAVMKRSFEIYEKSKGAFDVTVEPLVSLWGFGPKHPRQPPTEAQIQTVMSRVGMDKLALEDGVLYKKVPGVRIDLNGIAQGYTVDVLADFVTSKHIDSYMVELGGELKTKGLKPGQERYTVAIERPEGAAAGNFVLAVQDCAVTTSGNYRKTFDLDGKKIHHHINPFDGYPVQNNIASVTVIAKTAMDADGYDNVFMALPLAEGLRLVEAINDLEIYVVYLEDGNYKEAFSKGFNTYIQSIK